jgi:dUTP pyrophosphatase
VSRAHIKLLLPLAIIPTQGTLQSAGYDLCSTIKCVLHPGTVTKIPLNLTIEPPQGTYIQIAPRSGLALKGITCYAGIVDADYRGNISVYIIQPLLL